MSNQGAIVIGKELRGNGSCGANSMETLEGRMLLAFGQTDTSFGTGGHAITSFAGASTVPVFREIHPWGNKIVAGGDGGLARYTSTGALDPTFGAQGTINLPNILFKGMAVDSSGRVYVLGTGSAGLLVLRYTSAGALDGSYAQAGTALVTANADNDFTPVAMAVQSDGRVLIAGMWSTDHWATSDARVYRLKADGTGDESFGSGGIVDLQLGTTNLLTPKLVDAVTDIQLVAGGKVLISGGAEAYAPSYTDPNTGESFDATDGDTVFAAARLTASGALDATYGSGGIARSVYASGVGMGLPGASATASDGSCAIAVNDRRLHVVEFTATGTIAFDQRADGYEFGGIIDMAAKSDGRFFILGHDPKRSPGLQLAYVSSAGVFSNVMYTNDAKKNTVDIDNATGAIALAADGEILVGGEAKGLHSFELAKFDAGNVAAARPDDFVNGRFSDISRDLSGGIHVAYYDQAANALKYAYRAPNGLWSASVILDSTPGSGQYLSMALNAAGEPAIAYSDGLHGDMKFAYKHGGVWKTETVESKGSVGLYPSLMFDNSGRPTMIYYNKTRGDLRFAVRNMTTNRWSFENVQTADDAGRSGDLEVDPATGRFACAYVDSTTNTVNYALHQKGGTWKVVKAAKTRGGAGSISLNYQFYSSGPSIAFYDAYAADLKLTTQNESGAGFTTRMLVSKGAVGLYNTLVFNLGWASVYTYDKSNDRVLLVDTYGGLTVTPIVTGGGKYLSVFTDGRLADMSYYDAVSGVLKVRAAQEPGSA